MLFSYGKVAVIQLFDYDDELDTIIDAETGYFLYREEWASKDIVKN